MPSCTSGAFVDEVWLIVASHAPWLPKSSRKTDIIYDDTIKETVKNNFLTFLCGRQIDKTPKNITGNNQPGDPETRRNRKRKTPFYCYGFEIPSLFIRERRVLRSSSRISAALHFPLTFHFTFSSTSRI